MLAERGGGGGAQLEGYTSAVKEQKGEK